MDRLNRNKRDPNYRGTDPKLLRNWPNPFASTYMQLRWTLEWQRWYQRSPPETATSNRETGLHLRFRQRTREKSSDFCPLLWFSQAVTSNRFGSSELLRTEPEDKSLLCNKQSVRPTEISLISSKPRDPDWLSLFFGFLCTNLISVAAQRSTPISVTRYPSLGPITLVAHNGSNPILRNREWTLCFNGGENCEY